MSDPSFAVILDRLSAQRHGRQWWARCPIHPERSASLSLRRMPDGLGWAAHCFGCGAGTNAVLDALGYREQALPVAEPIEGGPAWWDDVQRDAMGIASRQPWYDPAVAHFRARIVDLRSAAERLGPDDPAAWTMLAEASALEHEFRLMDQCVVPGLGW